MFVLFIRGILYVGQSPGVEIVKKNKVYIWQKLTGFGKHGYPFLKWDVCVGAIHSLDLLDQLL